jgi:hypothetical protein
VDDSTPLQRRELRRGSSGVFGSVVAPPLAGRASNAISQMPATVYPIVTRVEAIDRRGGLKNAQTFPAAAQAQAKRSFFGRSKQPEKPSVRRLGISGPVLNEEDETSTQPFARIQTIDLATAAANERARRDVATSRELVAQRQAPRPPTTISATEALQKSTSTKRKQMPTRDSHEYPIPRRTESESGLSVQTNGSSTSTSLSPGRDEIRRRSPRNSKAFDSDNAPFSQVGPRPKFAGLPSNPRQTLRSAPTKAVQQPQQQTVMYVNDIVYDDPMMVKSIISAAPKSAPRERTRQAVTESVVITPSGSVIHRPRPYRRDSDRVLFPSEPSPGHKHQRSKSGSSIMSRKSIFMFNPGSPSALPELPRPPPPTTVTRLGRILPNDTRSMTVDEKIQLLFPLPPGAKPYQSRRSSVPSIPRIPSGIFQFDINKDDSVEDSQSRRASKRTTIASFANLPSQNDKVEQTPEVVSQQRETYRFSANTYMGLTEIPVTPWDAKVAEDIPTQHKLIPTYAKSLAEESNDGTVATGWASLHSPTRPVHIAKSQQIARETYIQLSREQKVKIDINRELPQLPKLPAENNIPTRESGVGNRSRDLTITPKTADSSIISSNGTRDSFLLDEDRILPKTYAPLLETIPKDKWHTRIGDRLPMFSERRIQSRSRTMPPPTPLLLNSNGRQVAVVVRQPEPEQDHIDSPERAIQQIQAQLRKFEEPSRGSVGSLLRRMPGDSSKNESENDSRLGLLENLEKEMGQQENQWQQMQNNFDRDSILTLSPQVEDSEPSLSRRQSVSSSIASRSVARRARIRSGMTTHSKAELSTSTMSTQGSENSRASVWQKRLAEAQIEYLENAPALLGKQSINFLSLSKMQLGSPTPPDSLDSQSESGTDVGSDEDEEAYESEPEISIEDFPMPAKNVTLWQAKASPKTAATGRLWSPPHQEAASGMPSAEPAAKNVRPAPRFSKYPLKVESSNLWVMPAASNPRPPKALWGSRMARPNSIVTRPKTQKPQRKSRRVTFLPDIGKL